MLKATPTHQYVLNQLNAQYSIAQLATEKPSDPPVFRCDITRTVDNKLLHRTQQGSEQEALEDAVEHLRKEHGLPAGPQSPEDVLRSQVADLKADVAELRDTVNMLVAQVEDLTPKSRKTTSKSSD